MIDRLLYRIPEAAEAMGVSRAKGYELAARGLIPTIRLDGCLRVPVDALRVWIEARIREQAEAAVR